MRLAVLIFVPCLASAPAKAEFLMLSAPDAPVTHESETPAPHPKPKRHPLKTHVSPREPALSGFGDRVPLTFAVRQIVPAHFQVVYRCGPQGRPRRLEGRRAMAGDPRRRRAPAWPHRHRQRTQGDDRGRPSSLNEFFSPNRPPCSRHRP